ncbi:hypothetical protein M409DRAFT_29807 [Zasmidium cellare ATCC 36951]|uniref:Aromatic prenyltransferase n=1 Tax=Zasmidium cellare ATCC 36951 TaxID=1080233 RepID=A0A6A6C260_ZASCE|nr:uncharacterized protein M409DRAFT_29807 [Zasmidium cellare ATCC 36951]KAF2159809.1 hypothetical protein M409DRAFT_29807 [Zasmidium cellare ATCC 36951]
MATSPFDRTKFVSELTALCHSLDAPYSQQKVEQILSAFDEHLDNSYVWLRCTSKPKDIVNFRLAFHGKFVDTTSIEANAGWIDIENPLAKVNRSWSSRANAEEWCDFDPSRGIAKNWVYFQRIQPFQEILSASGLPAAAASRVPDLQAAGLDDQVNFAAVDYTNKSINVYFLLDGGLTAERAAKYVALAGSKPPSEEEVQVMSDHMNPMFTFGVTIIPETGHIPRVAFYATVGDAESFPPLKDHERLRKFYREAPCHDPKRLEIICWSYGADDSNKYMKGEASYAGYNEDFSRRMFERWIESPA